MSTSTSTSLSLSPPLSEAYQAAQDDPSARPCRWRVCYRTTFADGTLSEPQTVCVDGGSADAARYDFHRIFVACFGDTTLYAIDWIAPAY